MKVQREMENNMRRREKNIEIIIGIPAVEAPDSQ